MNKRLFSGYRNAWLCVLAGVWLAMATALPARELVLTRLDPQKTDRLGKEARAEYDLALKALDKILYDSALDHLIKALEADPENVDLRLMVVQMCKYLGDTRPAEKSRRYYDLAKTNLEKMIESPLLNPREKRRAEATLQEINDLQRNLATRDEKRHEYGTAFAKQYAKEAFPPEDEKGKEGQGKAGAAGTTGSTAKTKSVRSQTATDRVVTGHSNRTSGY